MGYWPPPPSIPTKVTPIPKLIIPPVLFFFYQPPKSSRHQPLVLKLFTPHPQLEMAGSVFLYFSHRLLPTSTCSHFWSYYNFNDYYLTTIITTIKCCHNWFLKKLKQYIKETRFYHHTFLFFCVMTCLSLTLCKKL